MTSDDPATHKFSDTWKNEVGDVADVDSVECCCACDAVVDREKESSPTKCPEPESECTSCHGQKDILPSAASYSLNEVIPLHFAE